MALRSTLMPLALGVLAVAGAACGGDDKATSVSSASAAQGGSLTIYSGREEEIVAPLFERFEDESGVKLEVRYGDSAELAATIAEEGSNSPADLFFAQDAGALGAVASAGALDPLPQALLNRVPAVYRDEAGHWVGTSGRVRVLAYNTDALKAAEVPGSVYDLIDARWKGKIGLAPTNASFQAFVSAMRLTEGEEKTRVWLEEVKANGARFYEKNSAIVEAVASGEIELGLVNHYYLALLKQEQPKAPVANKFIAGGDPGGLVNVAGIGVLGTSDRKAAAARLVEYLLSDAGQRFYADEAAESEYPLVAGIAANEGLPPLDSLDGPVIALGDLGAKLESTLVLLNKAGYTS